MSKPNAISLLHALSGAAAMVVSILTKDQIGAPRAVFRPLGFALFAFAMLLFSYAVLHLREAFGGNVEPVTDKLIRSGPYRWIRHPLYLAMIIMIIGISIATRSWVGLVFTMLVFIPLTIARLRLEDDALNARFGSEWEAYAKRTGALIPYLY
jgi:protein-S-isoprenylcysteine O-methyltransferase Ste14